MAQKMLQIQDNARHNGQLSYTVRFGQARCESLFDPVNPSSLTRAPKARVLLHLAVCKLSLQIHSPHFTRTNFVKFEIANLTRITVHLGFG
jgi:hypothetical protein